MISFLHTHDGLRFVFACDSCGKAIEAAASAVAVPWASRAALVVHDGACLDFARLQYPSIVRAEVVPLVDALDHLAAIRDGVAEVAE